MQQEMTRSHSQEYEEYLRSPQWQRKRAQALRRAGWQCQRCGLFGRVLEVHHLTYERLKHELPRDLLVVCHPCHEQEDQEREARRQAKNWESRLDGWARKVYGPRWLLQQDYDQVERRFVDWLGDRDDR